MQQQDMDGPYIEEVTESPSREVSIFRDAGRAEFASNMKSFELEVTRRKKDPEFVHNSDKMWDLVGILDRQIEYCTRYSRENEYPDDVEEMTSAIRRKREKMAEEIKKLENRYFAEKDERENSRREIARRRANYSEVTVDRSNNTRLQQSSYRRPESHATRDHYSSDEENYHRRDKSRSPTYSRSYDQSRTLQNRQADNSTHYRRHHDTNVPSGSQQVRMRSGKSRVTKTSSRKWRPGHKALAEIRKYQRSTDMLIQKAPFARLVHEIVRQETTKDCFRIRADALCALQEAAEAFLVEMFEGSVLICNHAKRVTLMPTDIQLYRRLCLRNL